MFLSEISVRRPVATAMFFVAILILGVISLMRLPVDLLPNVAYPKLTIKTTYTNIPPIEVEKLLTVRIEQAVGTVPRVRRLTSVSKEGVSLVTTEFLWGTNMDIAALNIREKLDRLRWSLPREAGRPTILRLDPRSLPVMTLSVTGGDLVQLKEFCRNVVKRRLEQIKGVAIATVTGGFDREILVEVDSDKLTAFGLSIEQIASALSNANRNLPGGTIKKGRYRYVLRTLGEFQNVNELNEVVVARNRNGAVVLLRDVASVTDSFRERDAITRLNGAEAIGVLITKEAGANSVEVSRRVREVLKHLSQEFAEVKIAVVTDQAEFISEAIANVMQAVALGGFLSFIVLFFFLQDVRSPVAIATVIPIAILATFAFMFFGNVSLNIISLSGLALGVGMLVDNSIVVLENIFRHRQHGAESASAATTGAREVAMPITASTLTTIAVFFPIIYVPGIAGQLFRDQSLTVSFSLLASLLVALTLLPMMASMGKRSRHVSVGHAPPENPLSDHVFCSKETRSKHRLREKLRFVGYPLHWLRRMLTGIWRWQRALWQYWAHVVRDGGAKVTAPMFRAFDRAYVAFARRYELTLQWALDNRLKVLSLASVVFLLSLLLALTIDRRFMPAVDRGVFVLEVELPPGSSLETTGRVVAEIESKLMNNSQVAAVFTQIGMAAEQSGLLTGDADLHRARLTVTLKEGREVSTATVIEGLRRNWPANGSARVTFESGGNLLSQFLGTGEADIAIKINGSDLSVLRALLAKVHATVSSVAGLTDLHSSYEQGRPEIRIQVDREAVGRYGLSARQVADFVQNQMQGAVTTQFKDFDRKIDIRVRPALANRDELGDLLNGQIRAGKLYVPVRLLVHVERRLGPTAIHREDQVREVILYGNVQGRAFSEVIEEVERRLAATALPFNYQITVGGQREEMQRSFRSLLLAFFFAAALVYMILAAQFESLVHPFIISFAVPLALVGVVLALFLTGQSMNLMSMIGVVVLIGIVVNDAIIKVDFINQERKRGAALRDAIVEAGRKRLRPILMTTATTVLGLLPMALGFGGGAEMRRPLAVAVIGGLLSATFLTLIVIPVIYSLIMARNKN